MDFDKKLKLSNENFSETIKNSPVEFSLDSAPHASRSELLHMSRLAYNDDDLPTGWLLLTRASNRYNDYRGIAWWSPTLCHVAVAHRGTVWGWHPGTILADIKGVYWGAYSSHLLSAITFVERIAKVLRDLNKKSDNNSLQLSITGHSLGGWLGAISTFTSKYLEYNLKEDKFISVDSGLHPHTIIFDSPGSEQMMRKIRDDFDLRNNQTMLIKALDITVYLLEVNPINTTNNHVGRVRLSLNDTNYAKSFLNIKSHSLSNFNFHPSNKELVVVDWSKGLNEIIRTDDRVSTEVFLKNRDDLRIFSTDELSFLRIWESIQNSSAVLNKENFSFLKLENIDLISKLLKKFRLNKGSIECSHEEELDIVIRRTKQIVRWYFNEVMEELEMTLHSVPAAFYRHMSEVSLQATPALLLECKDTLGLGHFLNSEEQILCLETDDITFEAARLLNILQQMDKQCIYINYSNLLDLSRIVDIASLHNKGEFKDVELLIVDCAVCGSKTPLKMFKIILENMGTCKNIKIVLLHLKRSLLPKLIKDNFNSDPKRINAIEINDLREESIEILLNKKLLIYKRREWSLREFLNPLQIGLVDLQRLIKEELKALITGQRVFISIDDMFPEPKEWDTLVSRIEEEVNPDAVEKLKQAAQGPCSPVLVITGEGEEGPGAFHQECFRNFYHPVYWLHRPTVASPLVLKEIFHQGFYLHRRLHNKMMIDIESFIKENLSDDVFVIHNLKDNDSLASILDLSEESEALFKENINYYTAESYDDVLNSQKNIHHFSLESTGNNNRLVWKNSSQSLESIRLFVSPDYNQSVEEMELWQSDKRLVILADQPGMGKSSTLTNIMRLVEPSCWAIRIDLKNFQQEILNLPSSIDMESVIHFLTVSQTKKNTTGHCLLQYCLETSLPRVLLLFDGFDEIQGEGTDDLGHKNVINLIKFLIDQTSAKIIITTRLFPKDYLEREFLEFATVFHKINEVIQKDFLVEFWSVHFDIMESQFGELEKQKLKQETEWLYKEAKETLGGDIQVFMGVPLQLRMLAETYRKSILLGTTKIFTSVLDLYNVFLENKWNIYLNDKTESNIRNYDEKLLHKIIKHKHRLLGFQTLGLQLEDYLEVISDANSDESLVYLNRFGLVQLFPDGQLEFIHRTFAEFFCADLVVLWLQQKDFQYKNIPLTEMCLSRILLLPEFNVVRIFINEYLTKTALSETESNIIGGKFLVALKSQNNFKAFRDSRLRTVLHTAAEENKKEIIRLFMNPSSPGIVSEDSVYSSFLAALDVQGCTALCLLYKLNDREQLGELILNFLEEYPFELKTKYTIASLLRYKTQGFLYPNFLYRKIKDFSQETKSVFERIEELLNKTEVELFIKIVEEGSREAILNKFNKISNKHERYYMPLAMNTDGRTGICVAAGRGLCDIVKLFYNEDVAVSRESQNYTPLHCAINCPRILSYPGTTYETTFSSEHFDVIKFLVSKGVDVNDSYNYNRESPLTLAARDGLLEVVKYLVENNASVNGDYIGSMSLLEAAKNGHLSVVEYLLENNAFIEGSETICSDQLLEAAKSGRLRVVQYLLEKNTHLLKGTVLKNTLLLEAAAEGHMSVLKYLLQNNVNINCRDGQGRTPLLVAIRRGHVKIIKYLFKKKANVNCSDLQRDCPLLGAAQMGHLDIVQYLLDNNANVHCSNVHGITPLLEAAKEGHLEIVKILLKSNANVNGTDHQGNTPILQAARWGYQDIVEYLFENEADANLSDVVGITPLLEAARGGYLNIVKFLSKKKCSVNLGDINGNTPILEASRWGHLDILKFLIENGADINCKDYFGNTPLLEAAGSGHLHVVKYLVENGADIRCRDVNGRTPHSKAIKWGRKSVAKYLTENMSAI